MFRVALAVLSGGPLCSASAAATRLPVSSRSRGGGPSAFADGGPIATVALEAASTSELLRHACQDVFVSWQQAIAGYFSRAGAAADLAADLATYVLAAFEGAIVLSRAAHDTRPLHVTAGIAARTVQASLDAAAPG